jgi:hypothetical protein
MAKKRKRIWKTDAERDAWDAHVDETVRELRELAAKGRAELGLPPVTDTVAHLRELAAKGRAELDERGARGQTI